MSSGAKQKYAKKTGHYVPSRYKQAAEKASVSSHVSREKSTFLKNSTDGRGLQISGNSSQDTLGSSKLSTSQDNRGMTSTPTSKGELTLPLLDASAVTDTRGHLTVPFLKERIGPLTADTVKKNLVKKYKSQDETLQLHGPVVVSYKDKKKNEIYNEKIAEAELDLLYASYLQAAFLVSEAKKAMEARSSSALELLHKLLNLVLQHLYKVKSQKCSLKIISSLIEVHKHCQKQEDILKPVFEIIPTVEEQYKSLAEAVNATKHKLHIKDIVLPVPGSEGEILEILQKMTEFITAFFEILPNYEDIISSADVLKNYVDAGELITDALQRGLNLLMEARELYFSEASLTLGCEKL